MSYVLHKAKQLSAFQIRNNRMRALLSLTKNFVGNRLQTDLLRNTYHRGTPKTPRDKQKELLRSHSCVLVNIILMGKGCEIRSTVRMCCVCVLCLCVVCCVLCLCVVFCVFVCCVLCVVCLCLCLCLCHVLSFTYVFADHLLVSFTYHLPVGLSLSEVARVRAHFEFFFE